MDKRRQNMAQTKHGQDIDMTWSRHKPDIDKIYMYVKSYDMGGGGGLGTVQDIRRVQTKQRQTIDIDKAQTRHRQYIDKT